MRRDGVLRTYPHASSRRLARSRRGDQRGFTLVELLVTCAILPLVGGAIAVALTSIISLQSRAAARISDSADAQVVSTNFETDVHSSQEISTASTPLCGPNSGSQTQLLGLEWGITPNQTAVSYDIVTVGTTTSMIRNYCSSGPSVTPTSSRVMTHGISTSQLPPTVSLAAGGTAPSGGLTSSSTVSTVTFSITTPASGYSYNLVSTPQTSASSGQLSSVSSTTSSCGFATPGTGTYASTLCFVDFSALNVNQAQSSTESSAYCPSGGQKFSAGIASTPYSLTFCLMISPAATYSQTEMDTSSYSVDTRSTSSHCVAASSYGSACPVQIPTYFAPPSSEAFLGNNGFYTGIAGHPALESTQSGGTLTPDVTLSFTKIQLLDSNGNAAQKWVLVTGDSESTDQNEYLVWSTCSSVTVPTPPSVATCASSSLVHFSLLPDSPGGTQAATIGNACAYGQTISGTTYSGTFLTGVPASGAAGSNTVECAASVSSDKTGTVMLKAPSPTTLNVTLGENAVGDGLQAFFLGILLP